MRRQEWLILPCAQLGCVRRCSGFSASRGEGLGKDTSLKKVFLPHLQSTSSPRGVALQDTRVPLMRCSLPMFVDQDSRQFVVSWQNAREYPLNLARHGCKFGALRAHRKLLDATAPDLFNPRNRVVAIELGQTSDTPGALSVLSLLLIDLANHLRSELTSDHFAK